MRPNMPIVIAAFVLGCVILLAVILSERAAGHDYQRVETTTDTTPSTTWLETQPSLGDGFEKIVAAHRPRPKAKARTAPTGRSGASYPTDELLYELAMCETGGTMDQRATSKSGRYLSYFQWALSTWHAAGGVGDPRDASYEYQVTIVRPWILKTGWRSQFPVCSQVIGAVG